MKIYILFLQTWDLFWKKFKKFNSNLFQTTRTVSSGNGDGSCSTFFLGGTVGVVMLVICATAEVFSKGAAVREHIVFPPYGGKTNESRRIIVMN